MNEFQPRTVAVLLVDDDGEDASLTRDLLHQTEGTSYAASWVNDYATALAVSHEASYDVCLVDYRHGAEEGIALVPGLISRGFETPISVPTGLGDRAVDLEATGAGAADYLIKGEVTPALLERTIRYAAHYGCETILVAEDEDVVRHLEREVLVSNGYTVLEAAGPLEAIELDGSSLAKPLTPMSLPQKVRDVLDATTLRRAS